MILKHPLLIALCFLSLFVQAQIKNIVVSPLVYNYGDVSNWKNPPATFTIINKGDKPLVFLPTFPLEDLLVELPTAPVNKNESATITVYYYTSLPGSFQKETKVYVNVSDQPLILKIQGDISSISADALISCPTVSKKTFAEQQSFNQTILVIDSITKEPIEAVAIKILGNDGEYNSITDKSGQSTSKIMLGLHDILVYKKGYHPELRIFYLNKNTGTITVELRRDNTYKEPVVAEIKEDTVETIVATEIAEEIASEERTPETKLPTNIIQPDIPLPETKLLPTDKYNPNNIVFLIDASGSMKSLDKLPLLKKSMKELLEVLRGIDKLSMVTYAAVPTTIFAGVTADKKEQLHTSVDSLQTKGWTNGVKGIETAYALAEKHYAFNGNNQVILATDGLFNNPDYDESALIALIKKKAEMGIKLSIVGFGNDIKAFRLMKKLAFVGRGNFIQIKPDNNAISALIEEIKNNSAK
jgi:Ca-activated chloride channel family protein